MRSHRFDKKTAKSSFGFAFLFLAGLSLYSNNISLASTSRITLVSAYPSSSLTFQQGFLIPSSTQSFMQLGKTSTSLPTSLYSRLPFERASTIGITNHKRVCKGLQLSSSYSTILSASNTNQFSFTTTGKTRNHFRSLVKLHRYRGGGISSSSLHSSSSSNFSDVDGVNGSNNKKNQPKKSNAQGQTGWNHNLPSPSSSFWSSRGDESISKQSSSQSTKEPRTGWLHNTSPSKSPTSSPKNIESSSNGESKAQRRLRLEKQRVLMNHRIITPPTFHPCGAGRRAVVTEHKLSVPLVRTKTNNKDDDDDSSDDRIDVFFTIVDLVTTPQQESFFLSLQQTPSPTATSSVKLRMQQQRAVEYVQFSSLQDADSCCLYLQGGPGFGAPTPISGIGLGEKSSWVGEALSKGYKKVVLMDQRGTGRSTPVTKQTLEKRFPRLFALDQVAAKQEKLSGSTVTTNKRIADELDVWEESHPELAAEVGISIGEVSEFLSHFRADNIVKDAEEIKDALMLPLEPGNEVSFFVFPRVVF